jgi:hypothetical protein
MVERELARIERLAMAQEAISAVERAGGTAHYHPVDLTDGAAVSDVMAQVVAEHGRVDVLLHAAGLEISRALPDKEAREYDLVFDVKSDGWFHLTRALVDVPVAATVAFSSVAGRFGNAGQTDYSAANDLLCKLTSAQRTTRPQTRSIVIDWTAWGGIGMATRGSIPTVMAQAGIEMLDPAAGIATIRRELTAGGRSGEIVVGTELGVLVADFAPYGGMDIEAFDVTGDGPMIGRVTGFGPTTGLTVETSLDPTAEPFLDHHRIDGTPVMPGVMGIEGFAEVARLLLPERYVVAVEDVDFREPLKFYRDQSRTVTISALISPDEDGRTDDVIAHCRLTAARTLPGQEAPQTTVHFTGQVRLAATPPQPERKSPPPAEDSHTTVEHDAVYAIYFHGPAFQVVEHAWRGERGVAGRYATHLPPAHRSGDGPVIARPRLVELCFQTAGIEELGTTGRMALPMHVDRIVLPEADTPADDVVAEVQSHGEACFDARVIGPDGGVLVQLEGYRTIALPDAVGPELLDPLRAALATT